MEKIITPCTKEENSPVKKGPKKETLQRLLNYSKSIKAVGSSANKWLIVLN